MANANTSANVNANASPSDPSSVLPTLSPSQLSSCKRLNPHHPGKSLGVLRSPESRRESVLPTVGVTPAARPRDRGQIESRRGYHFIEQMRSLWSLEQSVGRATRTRTVAEPRRRHGSRTTPGDEEDRRCLSDVIHSWVCLSLLREANSGSKP
jgi:hypothetical protein